MNNLAEKEEVNQYRNLDNQDYWIKRSEEQVDKHWDDLKNVEKELAKQYRLALADIQQMVNDLYGRYATDNGLSYTDAVKKLNKSEMADYHARMQRLLPQIKKSNDPKLIAEYEMLSKLTQLNRLQSLMAQIEARLLELSHEQTATMHMWLAGLFAGQYYGTLHEIQTGTGVGYAFTKLNENAIVEAITMPWSGNQFSDLIWHNKDNLVKDLRGIITQGIIKGQHSKVTARQLADKMDVSYANALRLVRTETGYVVGEATAKGYTESKVVDQYLYLATLDGRTSTVCRKIDNKVFKLVDKQVGINYPPLHPNCRSAVAPYFGALDGTRIARGEDGKNYKVPANMSYQEWYNKYVKDAS